MTKVVLLVSLFSCLIFTSCTTINKSQRNGSIDIEIQGKLSADIDVDMNRVLKGTASESRLFGVITLASTNHYLDGVSYNGGKSSSFFGEGLAGKAKAAAAYNALRGKKDVDILVAPQYAIKVKNVLGIYRKVTATVMGYAGKIKRIKKK